MENEDLFTSGYKTEDSCFYRQDVWSNSLPFYKANLVRIKAVMLRSDRSDSECVYWMFLAAFSNVL